MTRHESISDAPLNALSFFVADHNPMTKTLVRGVEDATRKEPVSVSVLAQLANSLYSAVSNQKCVVHMPINREESA